MSGAQPLGLLLRRIAFALAVGDLSVDLGLLSVPFSRFAIDIGFDAIDAPPSAIQRLTHSLERFVASSWCRARAMAPLIVGPLLALVGTPFALIRETLALIGEMLALIGTTVSFVRDLFTLVSDPVSFVCSPVLLCGLVAEPPDGRRIRCVKRLIIWGRRLVPGGPSPTVQGNVFHYRSMDSRQVQPQHFEWDLRSSHARCRSTRASIRRAREAKHGLIRGMG